MIGRAALGAVFVDPPVGYAAIQPAVGWPSSAAFAGEAISLAALMAFVVAFLTRPALMRWTPAVVAAGVAVLIFAGGLTSGGSFNPARQLGPLLFAGRFSYLWAYMLGPIAGAAFLVLGSRSDRSLLPAGTALATGPARQPGCPDGWRILPADGGAAAAELTIPNGYATCAWPHQT